MARNKIALVGAGQIGGTMALLAAQKQLGDIITIDIAEGVPQGKSLDILHGRSLIPTSSNLTGSNSYDALAGADVVIVTAGLPRKPGMSRDDLLDVNFGIIKTVGEAIKKNAIPVDPWGNPYQYKCCPGDHGEYDLWSDGADGKPGGEGESADIASWTLK